uniref:C-type lectin domain-containing protein n=1 Tax=Periophthalmus magnuspinnatus TaxID=409849 RepID=A0A3B4APP4_9GOBI
MSRVDRESEDAPVPSFRSYGLVVVLDGVSGLYVGTCALEFNFVNMNLSWTEAQQFCRETYTDLATVHNTEDLDQLVRPDWYSGDAWIGLVYSAVTYLKWGYRGYYQTDGDMCLESYPNGWWSEYYCSGIQCFVCYRGKV